MATSPLLLTKKAIEFLEQQTDRDKPFFLYLSHKAVHDPFTPEPKYKDSLKDEPFEFPASSEAAEEQLEESSPAGLLDQRNSWHGMDFALHTGQSVEGFYKRYCEALDEALTTASAPLSSS